ncbi:hypothetical protein ACFV6Z_15825 [Streptomyces sp. NPDC059818]
MTGPRTTTTSKSRTIPGAGSTMDIAFSPDGTYLAGVSGRAVQLWSITR